MTEKETDEPEVEVDRRPFNDGVDLVMTNKDLYFAEHKPSILAVNNSLGDALVIVHHDGRLEYGEGYDPDEAAQAFWVAISRHFPNREAVERAARLETELAYERARFASLAADYSRLERELAHRQV